MQIVSLIPSATEMIAELIPDRAWLVGVTHECDHPDWVRTLPRVVAPFDPSLPEADPADVDRIVQEAGHSGQSIYRIDEALLKVLKPDLIVTQRLCDVCAVSGSEVQRALAGLDSEPTILELHPESLADVLDDILRVGAAVDRLEEAGSWRDRLERRLHWIGELPRIEPAPRVLVIEWSEPIGTAGHWVPEMTLLAGGEPLLASPGEASRRCTWDEVLATRPEFIVLACCGYDVQRNADQLARLSQSPAWSELPAVRNGNVYAVDANAFFSRPGPRLVEGAEILMAIFRGIERPTSEVLPLLRSPQHR